MHPTGLERSSPSAPSGSTRTSRGSSRRENAASGDRFDAGFLLFSLALLATFVVLVLVLSGKI